MSDLDLLSVNALLYSSLLMALAPLLVGGATCYVKVSLVVTALRNAFGSQQIPGNILISAFSLSLSFMIMQPVIEETVARWEINQARDKSPSSKHASSASTTISREKLLELSVPWRRFMLAHAGEAELDFICSLKQLHNKPTQQSEVETVSRCRVRGLQKDGDVLSLSLQETASAFMLSEVKSGFTMAFLLLVPFFVVDMAVAIVLTGLNMQMVSPLIVSFPLKLMLFVLTDAWQLLFEALFLSYQ